MNLNTIALYWTDNCIGETGYKIDRQIDGGAWETAVGTVGADIQTWSDSNVPLNAGVQYRIYAYTATDQSSYGYSELITNNIPMPVLDTVSQLSVGSFKLDWTDNSNGEDGFKIERKIDDGTYTQIATPAANTVTYTDSSINKKGYTTVFYRIKAYKGTDESDYSENSQTVSFPAPTGINYSKVSVNSINVTWADNSDGEDGFKIDKKVGALAWVTGYGSAAANATSWLDTNAEPNTSIQYKVYAYKGLNTSASNLSAVIDNTFPAPTNISTEKLTLSSIKLNWNDNSTGETGFIIERKVGVQNWAAYDSTATNAVTWTDANATINETLQYRIRAYKDNYASTNLESAQIDNTIPAPSNLNANVNGMSITLNWQDNSTGEDGFKIDRMVGDGVWEDDYASVGSNIITWNETVADTGKYYYRVKASVAESSSTYSEISEAWINQIVTYIKTYGEASQEERGYSIINVDDGYIVTGMCNPSGYHDDILLLKLNYNGNKIFEKQINPINGNCNDIGYSVVKTEDDGFFVTGVTDGNGANDVLLVKTDNNGDMQWYKTYGSAYADEGRQIINCSDGNYVIVGTLDGYPSEGFKVLLLKIDPLGNSIWQKTFTNGSSGNQYGYSVAETADGDFVIAGTTTAQTLGGKDAFIIKTNSSGDLIWAENYGTTMEDEAFSITISPDNKYVFAGYNGIGSQDIWLVKLDTNNSVIWNKTYGSTTLDDGAFSICKDPDNSGYIVGGYCQLQTGASQNFFIGKANSDGDFIWTKNYDYGLGRSEYGYTAIPTTDSGYIIVGYGSESSSNPLNNLMFVKTNSSGSVIKSK
ncbi:MAG: hypothetical protein PHC62_10365 [Candidatus Izemoplasmatales bacterium]|nr:hypothetical protein [Candidatus Izemoplasmatales bacterium]